MYFLGSLLKSLSTSFQRNEATGNSSPVAVWSAGRTIVIVWMSLYKRERFLSKTQSSFTSRMLNCSGKYSSSVAANCCVSKEVLSCLGASTFGSSLATSVLAPFFEDFFLGGPHPSS